MHEGKELGEAEEGNGGGVGGVPEGERLVTVTD